MPDVIFPHIKVSGSAYERGRQYGEQAAERVRRSIEIYRQVFQYYADWNWDQVVGHARGYEAPIHAYRSHFLAEMRGIAEGAGVDFDDVLAINVRTEIMFAAVARAAPGECTAFVALPDATRDGHTLIGQNWDWKPETIDTVVLLEADPDEGPRFITAVEAGLLAKTGMNAAGIGLVTNALTSNLDRGDSSVPYHLVLRAILESETMSEALAAITYNRRASSANYLIAHRDGEAINVEAAPGGYAHVFFDFPEQGIYAHTNHFVCPGWNLKVDDVGLWRGGGSLFRRERMRKGLRRQRGDIDLAAAKGLLTDHFNFPHAICAHEDPKWPAPEQYVSVFSLIMDLDTATLWLAEGSPCEAPYRTKETGLYERP
jgi:isopenicillin-N N-acyltransferase-like protein